MAAGPIKPEVVQELSDDLDVGPVADVPDAAHEGLWHDQAGVGIASNSAAIEPLCVECLLGNHTPLSCVDQPRDWESLGMANAASSGIFVALVIGLTSEGWNRTKVVERMAAIKAGLVEGITSLPKGRKTQLRFHELARWYLEELEATGGKNIDRKRLQLERRLVPALGSYVVETITEEHTPPTTTH